MGINEAGSVRVGFVVEGCRSVDRKDRITA